MMPGRRYTPATILWIIKKRKWLLVGPFVACACATSAMTFSMKDKYRAQTTILVVPQRVPENYVRSAVNETIEQRLQSINPQIMSESRLQRIVTELDLYPDKRKKKGGMDEIVEDMRSDISVEIIKGDLFRVTYMGDDPYRVLQVTQRLASLFVEENLKDREQLAVGTNRFLESQLETARKQLEEQERRVQDYRQRHAGELPSQVGSNVQVLQTASFQLQGVQEAISRDRDRHLELERTLADLTDAENAKPRAADTPAAQPAAPPHDASAALSDADLGGAADLNTKLQRLQTLQQALQGLELRFKPDHPDVIRTKRVIADLQKSIDESRTAASASGEPPPEPAVLARRVRIVQLRAQIANLDKDLARKTADEDRLKTLIATYQSRIESEPARELELIGLTRDYDTVKESYRSLLAKKEESGIAANLERQQVGQQFRTLDPARLPEKPFGPNRTLINAAGAGFGLAIALGLTVLLELRDQSFRAALEVLPTLSLPVLASVPAVTTFAERRRAKYLALSLAFLFMTMVVSGAILAHRAGMFSLKLR